MTQTAKYFYATGDSANGIIAQNAKIEQFDSREAACAYLATLYLPRLGEDENLIYEIGDFAEFPAVLIAKVTNDRWNY